jgi:hypothetical protein
MKNSKLASKVFEALEEKCEEFRDYKLWCEYLEANKIHPRDYDNAEDAAEDLMEMANDGTVHIICFDPFRDNVDNDIGGFQFLMVPKEIADKIAMLKGMP